MVDKKKIIADGYYPIDINFYNDIPLVQFSKIPVDIFDKPFYNIAYDRLIKDNPTPASLLLNIRQEKEIILSQNLLKPKGFVYHMSRCGSTLVSQMLSQANECRVPSEPEIINKLILKNINESYKLKYFQTVVNAFGINPTNDEKHLIFKFASQSISEVNLIQKCFPDVPWIFIMRNPLEVMVASVESCLEKKQYLAQLKMNASQFLNLTKVEIQNTTIEELNAMILGYYLKMAYNNMNKRGLVVEYKDLPNAVFNKIIPHFKLSFSDNTISKMISRSEYSSKGKQRVSFTKSNENKLDRITFAMEKASEKWILPWYEKLKAF